MKNFKTIKLENNQDDKQEKNEESKEVEKEKPKDGAKDDKQEAKNDTNTTLEVEIISAPPFTIENPNQMIYYEGNTLKDHEDYTSYTQPVFFTISIISVNMFEKKGSHVLNESISFQSIREEPYILLGSTKCIFFKDFFSQRNITLCAKDKNEAEQLIEAYKSLRRLSESVVDKKSFMKYVSRISCNKITDRSGRPYDYLETQQILKKKLEENGIPSLQASIDPLGFSRIRDTKERIRNSKYLVPGTEPEFKEKTWGPGKFLNDNDFTKVPLVNTESK
jgi:hypothetical protein